MNVTMPVARCASAEQKQWIWMPSTVRYMSWNEEDVWHNLIQPVGSPSGKVISRISRIYAAYCKPGSRCMFIREGN